MDDLWTIEDGWVAGRPGPTRLPWDLAALKTEGYTVIVSFECDRLDPREIRAAGIEHKMICVDDFTAPTIDQLFEFNEFVDRKLKEGKKVLTHCYAGRGRTGTFLASRLIWRGEPVDKAVKDVRAKILASQGTLAGAIESAQTEALHHFAKIIKQRPAETMSAFKEIELGIEGLEFIRERLAEGKSLSQYLLSSCDLEDGKVTAYLPDVISDQEAKQFSTGGKLPVPEGSTKYLVTSNGSRWRMKRKPNVDAYAVRLIRDFLGAERSCCLFEDALSSPTDPRIQSPIRSGDERIRVLGDEVYYMLDEKDAKDQEKIAKTMREANSDWRFVCLMSSLPGKERLARRGRSLTADDVRALAERAEKIVVGAYDGEGYLVWSKNPRGRKDDLPPERP